MKGSFFQTIILIAFGSLAFAGVLVFALVVSRSNTSGVGNIVIWGTLNESAFETIFIRLADTDSSFRNVRYVRKDAATYERELTNALASGTGPDIFILREDYAVLDAPKVLQLSYANLPREQFQSLFIEAADTFLFPDGVVAIPFLVDPLILYWNKDILATAGFSKPPDKWSDLDDMAIRVTERDETNSIKKSTIALGEYTNVDHAKGILSLLIAQAGGSVMSRTADGELVPGLLADPGAVQNPVQSALSFYTEFANPVRPYYSWNRAQKESRAAFAAGDLALYIGTASEEPLIRRMNPNLNFAVAAVPQIQGAQRSLSMAHVYGLAIPLNAKNPQGSITIAYALVARESAELFSEALGIPSARRDVLSVPGQGNDDLFNKQAIIARSWVDPNPEATDEIFRDMIEGVTSGASTLSNAIQRAQTALAQLVASEE